MRFAAVAMLCLTSGCAHRSVTVCHWAGARWDSAVPFRAEGGASTKRLAPPEAGLAVEGRLQHEGQTFFFRGTWVDERQRLTGEVDATALPVLKLAEPVKLGRAGVALPGAAVRVLDANDRGLLLALSASGDWEAEVPRVLSATCEALRLNARVAPTGPAAELASVGLMVRSGPWSLRDATAARVTPDGDVVGVFQATARVYVVDERDDLVRAVVLEPHVAWAGWIPRAVLEREVPAPAPSEPAPKPES